MMLNPRKDQVVQIWYAETYRRLMPLHGLLGVVTRPSRGKPRNHGVRVGNWRYVIPCGNLRLPPKELR